MAIYFFPLSLLNDVIHRVIICHSVRLPAPEELSRGWELLPLSGHSAVRQQLVCLSEHTNIHPPFPKKYYPSVPSFLFFFIFNTGEHLKNPKEIGNKHLHMDIST